MIVQSNAVLRDSMAPFEWQNRSKELQKCAAVCKELVRVEAKVVTSSLSLN